MPSNAGALSGGSRCAGESSIGRLLYQPVVMALLPGRIFAEVNPDVYEMTSGDAAQVNGFTQARQYD